MELTAFVLLTLVCLFVFYTYVGYPLLLRILEMTRGRRRSAPPLTEWPTVSITIPVYNEAPQIPELMESLLRIDYPRDRLQVLFVSDASDDGTDELIRGYADRGVELLRVEGRLGKTAVENRAGSALRGEIVVNTDASIRIRPDAVKHLVRAMVDPTVGVASGRDVSVSRSEGESNAGESTYVGYEMWVRRLETRVEGIVGASGCLYAIRSDLHRIEVPGTLNRDFISALNARDHGFRAVSVENAVCEVPRASSIRREYGRKVRTMTRGMETLASMRHLMNPFEHGTFAVQLFSHKLFRWLLPWAAAVGLVALLVLAPSRSWAAIPALGGLVGIGMGAVGWAAGDGRDLPRVLTLPAFVLMSLVAAAHASLRVLKGEGEAVWEPTRRTATSLR